MLQNISRVFSYIFYPLFIPYYSFLVLLNDNSYYASRIPATGKLVLEGYLMLTLVVLPFFSGYLLWRKKMIRTIFLVNRAERIYPLIVVAIFYYLSYYLLKGIQVSPFFSFYMLGMTFLVLCALVISFFHKISLYMIASGSLLGVLFGLTLGHGIDHSLTIMITLVITGFLATIRMMDDSHNAMEIYTGLVLGFVVMFLLFYFV